MNLTKRSGVFLLLVALACDDEKLSTTAGILEIEIRNVSSQGELLRLEAQSEAETTPVVQVVSVERPATFASFERIPIGAAFARVVVLDPSGNQLDAVTVRGILIFADQVSRIVVDFALRDPPAPTPEEICNGIDDDGDGFIDEGVEVLCGICQADASVLPADDDPLCGEIPCDALNLYALLGDNTATGRSDCRLDRFTPLERDRCADVGRCRSPHDMSVCGPPEVAVVLEAGICRTIDGCTGQTPPTLVVVPDGTACGPMDVCLGGDCVPDQPMMPVDPIGCADGQRDGFTDQASHPNIAACSGGWSVPGLRATLSPACNRAAGDDGANQNGQGCNVADLCAPGWRVCRDKEAVAAASATGCDGAVPPGTPVNGVLFVTRQRSLHNILCQDRAGATGVNDVFGCGNLGTTLDPSRNCGPLNRALASQHDGACDFNEAEPPLGPWVCGQSSIAESENIVKQGPDKGGVLCCRVTPI